ncbi:hypothetical protein MRB53_020077 [Persea americana]|uniref:Uncharacterized protein n=1 Tax=Persea americana TaxID=3435 RepID=A0ACC2L0D3_PERAE|nr:hypothetical protein MRB53_020077 [Persea americana]
MLISKSFMLLFLAFLLLLSTQSLGTSVLEDSCKRAAESSPNISYGFCVSSLRADPRSTNADLAGLGLIALDLTSLKATRARSHANDLLRNPGSVSGNKQCLQQCLGLYDDAMDTLKRCRSAYNGKRYKDVNIWVSGAMDNSDTCEEGFKERGRASPLTKENHDLAQLGSIVLAVTKFLGA